ncbi:MAG: hypothetical protein M3P34_07465 [Actinomycetota bacterium]|nr:hypothetical protein [Actinomycetota bacterium]
MPGGRVEQDFRLRRIKLAVPEQSRVHEVDPHASCRAFDAVFNPRVDVAGRFRGSDVVELGRGLADVGELVLQRSSA